MKNFMLNRIWIAGLLAAIFFAGACTGPQGPPGRDGNWNVFSIRYDVRESDWIARGTQGFPGYFLEVEFTVPEITQKIVADGMVLVYYRAQSNDPWLLLPYTYISDTNPVYMELLDFIYGVNFVNIKSQGDDYNATPYSGIFRVLVADATPIGKKAFDPNDYASVEAWLSTQKVLEIDRSNQ